MGGGKSEYDISLQFTEPKYGKVTVTHPSKSKPNVVVNISSNVVEEDYGNTTYSIGAVSVATVKGQTIQVNSVSNNNWSFIMPANDVIITASEIRQTKPCLDADTLVTLTDDDNTHYITAQRAKVGDCVIYNDPIVNKVHIFEGLGNKAWNNAAPGSTLFNYDEIPYDIEMFKRVIAPTAKYLKSLDTL